MQALYNYSMMMRSICDLLNEVAIVIYIDPITEREILFLIFVISSTGYSHNEACLYAPVHA